ncbi:hypothetical protein M7I_4584 [Glarea lozoyensis 74030]|uniref:Uncharacterized protein n=1 Tax=Glarea lozoyensis (strain ATCC 74030 / MF5533) TaxID=1104152 RepID=H0EPK3_GLAL7|nr:hypothetical protein M7I_4584 [Glarea lozoyensis 74030]
MTPQEYQSSRHTGTSIRKRACVAPDHGHEIPQPEISLWPEFAMEESQESLDGKTSLVLTLSL